MSDPSTQVGLSLSFISDAEISARITPPPKKKPVYLIK